MKESFVAVVGLLAAIALPTVFWANTCTNPVATKRALEAQGYTKVQTKGYGWFACAKDDWSHTRFDAVGPTGLPGSGVMCCGLIFKNCTVRW